MIIVSTTSPAEAGLAASALENGLPSDVGYSVHLNGKLVRERDGRAVHPAEPPGRQWPAPEPEVRG
jgi:hypothetical protein